MKILQVLDEISKKNISIVSVAKIISSYDFLSINSKIVVSKNLDKIKKIYSLKSFIGNFFFSSEVSEILKSYKPEIVHIHGIWRPIHFFFMIHCTFLRIPIIVQPHGMLLNEALKSKSFLSYIIKLFTLNIVYKILLSKSYFIAVTKEEKKSIEKYFPKAKIIIIKNPIEIKKTKIEKVQKKFVYFGRFNSHKNLLEFIEAFIAAALNKKWIFEIYGIEDDQNYKNKLKKLVSSSGFKKSILFKKPEFNIKKKFKIIAESWCNVLVSKSEILSLSVLEAFSVGTQSIVNKKIFFPNWIKRYLIFSDVNKIQLTKNIKSIMQQDIIFKLNEKYKMKKLFEKEYKFHKEKNNYKFFLEKIINKNKNIFISNNITVLFSNLLNTVLIPYLMIFSVIFKKSAFAAEIGVYPGILLLLTQVFSANARSLLLYNRENIYYDQVVNIRFYLGFFIFISLSLFQYLINYNENFSVLFILSLIIYFSWINEINLAIHEKNKSSFFINLFLILSSIFYLLIFFNFYFNYDNLKEIILFYLLFHILFLIYHINFSNFKFKKFILFFNRQFNEYLSLASSFCNILAVIIWRISLVFLIGKNLAGLYFASLAIASFPGTLFNNIAGQIIMINKNIKNFVYKITNLVFIFYIILICSLIILNEFYLQDFEFFKFFKVALVSLLGTPFMLKALARRHEYLSLNKYHQKKIFVKDIIYGFTISPIIVVFYYIGGENLLVYSYLLSSVTAFYYYSKSQK